MAANKTSKTIPFEIMDTTLRDGEQTQGVSMLADEKITIARALIEQVRVDRVEVTSALASKGEHATLSQVCKWARKQGCLEQIEILGFVNRATVDWCVEAGCRVINLLTKGSRKHCEGQLRKTLAQHLADIAELLEYGVKRGVKFNVYLEDWSGGMLYSPDHVEQMLERYVTLPFERIMLPDTLGILEPRQVREFVGQIVEKHPGHRFDFHAHNDYGLATANCLEGLRAGARAVHTTINGMGERTGNAPLDEIVVAAHDFSEFRCRVNEKKLNEISRLTEVFTGKRLAWNKPIVGEDVFTHTAGIHADGDKKGNLYESRLTPQRFGRDRTYAMGKLMGKASLDLNLKKLGIELGDEQKKLVHERISALSDAKKSITTDDLPFIITEVLQAPEERPFEVLDFSIVTNGGLQPTASVLVRFGAAQMQATASGDGGYDAFVKAVKSLEPKLKFKLPALQDYTVRIPPGGKTDALVETTITWEGGFKTRGVSPDQLIAAITATAHAINLYAKHKGGRPKPKRAAEMDPRV